MNSLQALDRIVRVSIAISAIIIALYVRGIYSQISALPRISDRTSPELWNARKGNMPITYVQDGSLDVTVLGTVEVDVQGKVDVEVERISAGSGPIAVIPYDSPGAKPFVVAPDDSPGAKPFVVAPDNGPYSPAFPVEIRR